MRATLLLFFTAAALAQAPREFIHAVEFPYHAYPRELWERELVWLRNIGIHTVAFPIPESWHQPEPGRYDFTGVTAGRRDLAGLLKLLRRLEMRAWVRGRVPAAARDVLSRGPLLREPAGRVEEISALASDALTRSRRALAGGFTGLLWRDVEDYIVPAGWEQTPGTTYRRGAVSVTGQESPAAAAVRRNAALLRHWDAVLRDLQPRPVRPAKGALPEGVTAVQLLPREANRPAAVSVLNQSGKPYSGELRVYHPGLKRYIVMPAAPVPARGALWLPVRVPLSDPRLCRNCSVFANTDHIVYATAELLMLEYENGVLGMEFAAPSAGEVVLQLSRQPSGPFLAGGRPGGFEWDDGHSRAHLKIPAGRGLGERVRISLAMEPPEMSGFLKDVNRLMIGERNAVTASFSSDELSLRARLRVPEGFAVKETAHTGSEVTYTVAAPADAVHGELVELALEADGVTLGRARVPLLRPATLRLPQALRLHTGTAELPVDPAIVLVDPRGSRNLEIIVRNHSNEIRTFLVEATGQGVEFSPAKVEISAGGAMERTVSLRVFAGHGGLYPATLRLSGGGAARMPVRLLAVPRNEAIAWQADLDGDGIAEHVLENYRVRAVFSTAGGRWLEFVWKDTGVNALPPEGALAAPGRVRIEASGAALRIGPRTVTLHATEPRLTIEQAAPMPAIAANPAAAIRLEAVTEGPGRVTYTLRPPEMIARDVDSKQPPSAWRR
jgi:hypothetical protein